LRLNAVTLLVVPLPVHVTPLAFEDLAEAARVAGHENLLAHLTAGTIDPGGVFVARRQPERRIVGVVLAQCMPGRIGSILPPTILESEATEEIAEALVRAACDSFRQQGMAFAQALFSLADVSLAEPLVRHGFRRVTTLLQMQREAPFDAPLERFGDHRLTFTPLAKVDAAHFTQALLATYEDSLDVPESGLDRSAEDVMAGLFDGQPELPDWWLASNAAGEPLAVLLLSAGVAPSGRELTYLGVLPAARRQGVARSTIRFLFKRAEAANLDCLQLCVDARNRPAVQLYRASGFRVVRKQVVFLWHPEQLNDR